LYIVKIAKRIY